MTMLEGTHDAEATRPNVVHREITYVPPRREGVPRFRVPTGQRYIFPLPHILIVMAIDISLVRKIHDLRFVDHDLHDEKKFPDFKTQ